MREIEAKIITEKIKDMCIHVNHYLSEDMEETLREASLAETSVQGKAVLGVLADNLKIAKEDMIPICQDTGMAVVFLEIGQDVHIVGGDLTEAVNEGVRRGYEEGYLRKSVVKDPLDRINTGDNTPAVIHYNIVPGDKVRLTVAPKGFGSENVCRIYMLKPADGMEGVKAAVLKTVEEAGPNACPPFVVGVGIGGDFEKCALMSKEALLKDLKSKDSDYIEELKKELLDKINATGIGPAGLGGKVTALAVNIKTFPTHIAGLPVAVSLSCHVNRHESVIL